MATRALGLTSRWQDFTSSLFRAAVSWPKPIKAQQRFLVAKPGVVYLKAFERAMQDVHGNQWKERLNHRQKDWVNFAEIRREKYSEHVKRETGDQLMRPARDDEYPPEWHAKVEKIKTSLLQKKAPNATRKAVSEAEQPESQA